MRLLHVSVLFVFPFATIIACAQERGSTKVHETPRWSLNGYPLGAVPDSLRHLLSCSAHKPDGWEPWVQECYGGPHVKLGFDADGKLAYFTEDMSWGDVRDARELWRLVQKRFVGVFGVPDTVTDAEDTTLGNKLWVYWSRRDVGDCAKLEVMSAPVTGGGRDRTVLTVGPRSAVPTVCPPGTVP